MTSVSVPMILPSTRATRTRLPCHATSSRNASASSGFADADNWGSNRKRDERAFPTDQIQPTHRLALVAVSRLRRGDLVVQVGGE
jgi:hypothetical protein